MSYKINTNSKDYSKIRMNVWIGEANGAISDKIYSLGTFFRSNDMTDSESWCLICDWLMWESIFIWRTWIQFNPQSDLFRAFWYIQYSSSWCMGIHGSLLPVDSLYKKFWNRISPLEFKINNESYRCSVLNLYLCSSRQCGILVNRTNNPWCDTKKLFQRFDDLFSWSNFIKSPA